MAPFLLRRLLAAPLVLFILFTLTFFLMRLAPGGPYTSERGLSDELRKQQAANWHLDRPLFEQYLLCLRERALRFDLGYSDVKRDLRVSEILWGGLSSSLLLGALALGAALAAGLVCGVVAAVRPRSLADYGTLFLVLIGISIPSFVLAPILIEVFAVGLTRWVGWRVFNAGGFASPRDLVLPVFVLALLPAAYITRLLRAGMQDVLSADFIRTARAKGLGPARVALLHGLRNGLFPVLSYLGPAAAAVLTGSVVVEKIFTLPGLGRHFVDAALNRDYNLILGTVLLYAAILIFFNFLVDLGYAALDPRVREQMHGAKS